MILRICCILSCCLVSTESVFAQVRLLNDSKVFISVELKGRGDTNYRGPWRIPPGMSAEIPVAAGDYRVRIERADGSGKRQILPLRDYSDCEITYHISLCTICAPISKTGNRSSPLPVETVFISQRVFRPNFTYGTYRLGVALIDDEKGARVIATEVGSPAYQMHRIGDGDTNYWLHEHNSIITHVNGRRIRNTLEFDEATARSPRNARFTVFSTTRKTAIEYQTLLRE